LHPFSPLFAYFGPEVQLPLLSVLGAISGVVMLVVRSPYRYLSRWRASLGRKSAPQ
jgi:hypothetical protein